MKLSKIVAPMTCTDTGGHLDKRFFIASISPRDSLRQRVGKLEETSAEAGRQQDWIYNELWYPHHDTILSRDA